MCKNLNYSLFLLSYNLLKFFYFQVGDFGTAKLLGPLRSKKKRKSKSKREIGEGNDIC